MNNGEQGSSLVEVMVAAMVALIIVGAVLSIVVSESHQRRATSETSLAMSAAVNNLEQIRTIDEATLVGLDGSGFDVPGPNGDPGGLQPVPGDMDGLPGLLTVVEEDSSGGVKIYKVVATVAWKGVSGTQRVRLQSLVGERK
jgi:type II secretory pathway pseudopilin PulG